MSGLPGRGFQGRQSHGSAPYGNDIFGHAGGQGANGMYGNGGVGNEGTVNLGTMLNPSGGTGQMFNPSVALGQGGLPGMMGGGGSMLNPQMLQGLPGGGMGGMMGYGGGGGGGMMDYGGGGGGMMDYGGGGGGMMDFGGGGGMMDNGNEATMVNMLQQMTPEDRAAAMAAMQGDDSLPQPGGDPFSGGSLGMEGAFMNQPLGGMGNTGLGGLGGLGGLSGLSPGPGNLGGIPRAQASHAATSSSSPTDAFNQEVTAEMEKATACQDPYGLGMNTVIVLDTSESMRGEGISQAKEAIEKLLSELETISMDCGLEENLAVITCGRDTRVIQHLTNDYQLIRQSLGRVQTGGNTPLQLAVSLALAAVQRAENATIHSHILNPRVIVISDGHATNPLNRQGPELVSEEASQQETPGVGRVIQSLITNNCLRIIYVPVGNPDSLFSSTLESMQGAYIVLAGDIRSLATYHMQQRVTAEVKEKKKGGQSVTKEMVKAVGQSQYTSLQERDIEAIVGLVEEPNSQEEFRSRYPQPSTPGGPMGSRGYPGMSMGQGSPGASMGKGIPGASMGQGFPGASMGQGFPGASMGSGFPGTPSGGGGGRAPASSGGNPLQRGAAGVPQANGVNGQMGGGQFQDGQEWPPRDMDTMPFQLPGLMSRSEGEETQEVTQEKINELLEKYGGGPPKKDNLPLPLTPGTRVTTGPNWMWRMNGVETGAEGTVVESLKDEENPTGEFDGWIRVRWDNDKEEDYRYGLDYEFDIEPLKGGMDAVEWPDGKERIIPEEEPLLNDDDDFVETMKKLINRGNSENQSENDENSASGFDPFGSPFGPEGVPPELNFLNPVHAEQYRKIREKAKNSPPLPYLSATQLSRRPTNPRPSGASTGNSSPSQGPPGESGGSSSNPPAGGVGSGTQAGQQGARAPSVIPNTTTAATASTKTTTTTDASATASKNKTDNEVCFVWQYFTDQGDWRSYPPEIQKRVESEYLRRKSKGSIVIDIGNGSERIIFQKMEQRNLEKLQVRPVRRVEADAEKLRELQEMWSST